MYDSLRFALLWLSLLQTSIPSSAWTCGARPPGPAVERHSYHFCVKQASGVRQAKLMTLLQKAEALGKPVSHPYTAIKLQPDADHPGLSYKALPQKSWYST